MYVLLAMSMPCLSRTPERTSIAIPFTEAVPKIDCVLMLVVVLVLVLVAIAPEAVHAIVPNAAFQFCLLGAGCYHAGKHRWHL